MIKEIEKFFLSKRNIYLTLKGKKRFQIKDKETNKNYIFQTKLNRKNNKKNVKKVKLGVEILLKSFW